MEKVVKSAPIIGYIFVILRKYVCHRFEEEDYNRNHINYTYKSDDRRDGCAQYTIILNFHKLKQFTFLSSITI